jgi:hypothetical protein
LSQGEALLDAFVAHFPKVSKRIAFVLAKRTKVVAASDDVRLEANLTAGALEHFL